MIRPRRLAIALALLGLGGCVTPVTPAGCRARAEQEYRRCVNPTYRTQGSTVEQARSDDAQACQVAYQQALSRCGAPAEAPVPAIGTATTS